MDTQLVIHHYTEYPTVCYSRPSRETPRPALGHPGILYPIRDTSIPGPWDFYNWSPSLRGACYAPLSLWPTIAVCNSHDGGWGVLLARDATTYLRSTGHPSICAPCTLQTWCANHRYTLILASEVEDSARPETFRSCLWSHCFDACWCVDVLMCWPSHWHICSRISILFPSACIYESLWNADRISPTRSNYLTAPRRSRS